MELTFIGHQSWLISAQGTNIVVDPVFSERIGRDDDEMSIYPPRKVFTQKMPKVDATVISHEHADHFHLPTIRNLKHQPICMGPLMPSCIKKILEYENIYPTVLKFQTPFVVGDLEVTLFPSSKATVFWESRVSQVLIRSLKSKKSVFLAIDALTSEDCKRFIHTKNINVDTVIVSNNAQITPYGVRESLENFHNKYDHAVRGLSILQELLVNYLEGLGKVQNIIICGGGVAKRYNDDFGELILSDQDELAYIANQIIKKNVYGLLPGQQIDISTNEQSIIDIDWITRDDMAMIKIKKRGLEFRSNPSFVDIRQVNKKHFPDYCIENALLHLARNIMLSEMGDICLQNIVQERHQKYGFLMKFRTVSNETLYYALNFNNARFEKISEEYIDIISTGIEMFLDDFIAILEGEIQVLDLAGIGMRSWYIKDILNSPIAFFYNYFGEQVQPESNLAAYKKRWYAEV